MDNFAGDVLENTVTKTIPFKTLNYLGGIFAFYLIKCTAYAILSDVILGFFYSFFLGFILLNGSVN